MCTSNLFQLWSVLVENRPQKLSHKKLIETPSLNFVVLLFHKVFQDIEQNVHCFLSSKLSLKIPHPHLIPLPTVTSQYVSSFSSVGMVEVVSVSISLSPSPLLDSELLRTSDLSDSSELDSLPAASS